MKARFLILLIAIIIVVVVFFYPKECGHGYGGFVQLGATIEREDCKCLGIKYARAGDAFGFGSCVDCGPTEFCAGIPTGKECFEKIAGNNAPEKKIVCK